MKKNLKRLILSLMITLTFALPQAIQGMEGFSEPGKQGVKISYALLVSKDSDVTEKLLQKRGKFEESQENLFGECPEEVTKLILQEASIDSVLKLGHPAPLKLVCKEWNSIIDKGFVHGAIKLAYELSEHEDVWKRFLKGKLIYKPNEKDNDGMIEMRISDFWNPLEGTFDLSWCGDAGKYLSISTGYRKGKKAENANKVEIWFAPRFLIEKELRTTAKHFQGIYNSWIDKAPVGIIWTWGGWDDLIYMDHLTAQNLDEICNANVYEKWRCRRGNSARSVSLRTQPGSAHRKFHVHFMT